MLKQYYFEKCKSCNFDTIPVSILCGSLPMQPIPIGHFTVIDGSEAEGDLVLIQTFFALLWKLFLKNTSWHKNNLIYIIKQEGLYQNKLTLSLASIHKKWPIKWPIKNFPSLNWTDADNDFFSVYYATRIVRGWIEKHNIKLHVKKLGCGTCKCTQSTYTCVQVKFWSDLPSEILVIHVADKQGLGCKGVWLDFNICSCHLERKK